jgi:dTDP-glucose 4,6-dehydratase
MKLLVTGGLGFIGSNFLLRLAGQKNPFRAVTVLDALCHTSNPELLPLLQHTGGFAFVEGDIANQRLVEKLMVEHNYVLNLAAQTFVDTSIDNSRAFFETNVLGLHSLLEAVRRTKPRRLVHVSTDEVWGDAPGSQYFNEASPYAPRNPYAASKAAGDHMVMAYGNTYGIEYNIIYLTNLIGPWQYPEKLIPRAILRLLLGRKVELHGTGEYLRTWLDVDDAVDGLFRTFSLGAPGARYIFGSNGPMSNVDVIGQVLAVMGRTWESVRYITNRPGQDCRYAVDCSKAAAELSWKPTIAFAKSLSRTVEWMSDNPEWWQRRLKWAHEASA